MFTNFTKLCKGLALVLVVGHVLVHFVPATVTYLALIPARYSSPLTHWNFDFACGELIG